MSGRMLRHQCIEALGAFSHRREVSLPDHVLQGLNLLTNLSQRGLTQNITAIPHQLFGMTNEEPGMFDGARPKHAATATRSGPFANPNQGPLIASIRAGCDFSQLDALSKINFRDFAGAHFSVLLRNIDPERFDVPAK